MNGWILYKDSESNIKPEAYEINKFKDVAKENGIDLKIISPEQFDLLVTRDDRKSIRLDGDIVPLPDFLLPRMGAGTTYFALAIIRHLEKLGVHSFNKSTGIETVKDKLYTQQILAASDLPFAKTMLVRFPINTDLVEKNLGFPIIIKTVSGSQGTGVFLAENRINFEDLMSLIRATKVTTNIILQEFITSSRSRDLRVITIGGRAIVAMKRIAKDGSFKANFSHGGSVESYELSPEIEWLSTEASRIFDLDIGGIDLLFDGEHFKICEVNSSPGFEGIETCHKINIAQEIFRFLRVRLGKF